MKKFKYKNQLKEINLIAIPIFSTYLLELLFTVIDQAIIGHTSVEGFAAVGIVASLIYGITGALGMISGAFNILFAKSIGGKNIEKQKRLFGTAITFSLLLGVLIEIVTLCFGKKFLIHFYTLSNKELQYACDYMYIAMLGVGINMILFTFSSYFKNIKKVRVYLYTTLVSTPINLFLDWSLVFGKLGFPKLGVKGAAIGTVVGLFASIIVCIICYKKYNGIQYNLKICKTELKEILKLFIPMSIQDFVECTLFAVLIMSIVSRLGTESTAIYNLLLSIISIVTFPMFSYAGSSLTLVSQADGMNNKTNIKVYPILAVLSALFFITIASIIIIINPKIISSLITNDINLINSTGILIVYAVGIQVFNLIQEVYKNSLLGLLYEKWVLVYSTIVSFIIVAIVYFLAIVMQLNLRGVWLGLGLNYFILSVGYIIKFYKGGNIHKNSNQLGESSITRGDVIE